MLGASPRHVFSLISFAILTSHATLSYALPFILTPVGPLPKVITSGGTVYAAYTVTNNTLSQRNDNTVTYVPPNTTVNQTTGCTSTFNLAPFGQAGDTCTLYLTITGAVDGTDSNPAHHLFVCFPKNMTCAGPSAGLNVALTQQIGFIPNNSSANTIAMCPIQNNLTIDSCASFTTTAISQPQDIIVNNAVSIAYVANGNTNTIASCLINTNGTLNACTANTIPTIGSGLTLSPANNLIYYTSASNTKVYVCGLNTNGSISTCSAQSLVSSGAPTGRIALFPGMKVAYVAQSNPDAVEVCQTNVQGNLFGCSAVSDPTFKSPAGVAINSANTYLYVANSGNDTISICPINTNGTLSACSSSTLNNTFNFVPGTAVNLTVSSAKNTTQLYVPNINTPSVSVCPIANNGSLGACTTQTNAAMTAPGAVTVATLPQN